MSFRLQAVEANFQNLLAKLADEKLMLMKARSVFTSIPIYAGTSQECIPGSSKYLNSWLKTWLFNGLKENLEKLVRASVPTENCKRSGEAAIVLS